MKLILLSQEFYDKYGHCKEILQKPSRPYISVEICIDGILYAIPLRHHIRHNNAFITKDESGLDFTKSIVIESDSFISVDRICRLEHYKKISKQNHLRLQEVS